MSLSRSGLPGIAAASRICLGTAQQPQDVAFAAAGGNFVDSAHVHAAWLPGQRPALARGG